MSYSLVFTKGRGLDCISSGGWEEILQLAQDYGWVPAGTTLQVGYGEGSMPEDDKVRKRDEVEANASWDGSYFGHPNQRWFGRKGEDVREAMVYVGIAENDAANMGQALVKAREDLQQGKIAHNARLQLIAAVKAGQEALDDVIRVCGDGSFGLY